MSLNSDALASYGLDPAAYDRLPDGWRNGAHDLALAILQQAIDDIHRFGGATDTRGRRMYRLAHTWVSGTSRGHLFSFESVCDALGLVPSDLRAKILDGAPPLVADRPRRSLQRPRARLEARARGAGMN
jgi:hypothetical protein